MPWWLLTVASAAPPSSAQASWEAVHAALLQDALGGDLTAAAAAYEQVAEQITPSGGARPQPTTDPSLAVALLWLGETRWSAGDVAGARAALDRCIRAGLDKDRCLDLRSQIDLEVDSVRTVPVTWEFDDEHHGFFHPRTLWDRGTIRTVRDGETTALQWTTTLDGTVADELVVGFRDPSPTPSLLRLRARSEALDGALQLLVEDTEGNLYAAEARPIRFPVGEMVDVRLSLYDFRAVKQGQPPLDPRQLHRLHVRDATALTAQTGRNIWAFDLFEVR
jgi:hypothetical protein